MKQAVVEITIGKYEDSKIASLIFFFNYVQNCEPEEVAQIFAEMIRSLSKDPRDYFEKLFYETADGFTDYETFEDVGFHSNPDNTLLISK